MYVWTPRGASRDHVVVYVHGFYDTATSAIEKHHLERQFAASGKRVPFVVVEAPTAPGQQVRFPDLSEVLVLAGLPATATVTAVAHSGGYSTVLRWLAAPNLNHVILLDAVYGGAQAFETWAKKPGHSLAIVGFDTADASQRLAQATGSPYTAAHSHMGIVTDGVIIPRLLAQAPLPGAGIGGMAFAILGIVAWGAWRLLR